jgi:hypothetical protein
VTPPPGREAAALVVAKAPRAGRTKTRLAPVLGARTADELGQAMLLDTLDACRAEVPRTGIVCRDEADVAPLRALAGDAEIVVQEGGGLADALCSGLAHALARASGALLVAADLPGLPPGALGRALALLDAGADVVLGPSEDGGYWLVGMREPHAAPFERIPWSTPRVLAATLERCAAAGLRAELADRLRDLDTPADLAALAAGPLVPGPRSAALLASLRNPTPPARRISHERRPQEVPSR